MLPVLSHFLVPRVISTTDEKFRLVCFCFRSALGGEQMEGLEFDVYASGPQTSLDLQGSGWVRLSVSILRGFWESEGLEEKGN